MGATIYAFLMLILLVISNIIFSIRSRINNKKLKYVLKLVIIIILALPVSWIVFLIYNNTMSVIENLLSPKSVNEFKYLYFYFILINILGIIGYIIYRIYLKYFKKVDNMLITIGKVVMFILHLNILCDAFPIILLFTEW